MQAAFQRRATLIVRESGTPMIGISGHAIAMLEKTEQVLVHGEVGPYTVVSYEGRNGYVLSDSLTALASLEEPSVESRDGEATVQGHRRRSKRFLLLLLGAMTASAWLATGAALGLI